MHIVNHTVFKISFMYCTLYGYNASFTQAPMALDVACTQSYHRKLTKYCYGTCMFNVHILLTLGRLSITVEGVLSSIELRRDGYAIARASSLHCSDNVARGQTPKENEPIDL